MRQAARSFLRLQLRVRRGNLDLYHGANLIRPIAVRALISVPYAPHTGYSNPHLLPPKTSYTGETKSSPLFHFMEKRGIPGYWSNYASNC